MITKKQYKNEFLYEMTMQMAQNMFSEGLITEEELSEIDTKMKEKYRPYFGGLCPAGSLI